MRFLTQKWLMSINIIRLFRKFLYAPSLNYLAVSVFVHVTALFGAFNVQFFRLENFQ